MSYVRPVHFVGSVPLSSAEDVFRALCRTLPARLKRIPDGETGERYLSVWFQRGSFEAAGVGHVLKNSPLDPPLQFTEDEITRTMKYFPELETGYDTAAIRSYHTFTALRQNGAIPPHIKFQVSLPSPANFIAAFVEPAFQRLVEPYYESALMRAIQNIQSQIPHGDLAVQFDMALDLIILHGAWPQAYIPTEPELMPHVAERVARLIDCVGPDVDVGFHFCYGDHANRRSLEPRDAGMMVDFALALTARVRRKVAWIHIPVPKDKEDEAYFEPLRRLVRELAHAGTELYLGLIHHQDLAGTERRMKVAKKVLGGNAFFGIATECGLGRRNAEYFRDILSVTLAASSKEIR